MPRRTRRTPTIAENTLRIVGVGALLYGTVLTAATVIEQTARLLGH